MRDRKQQILREASALIATRGYGAFTMRAVARASGLKLGALQYHFRTRDDLLQALVGFIHERYIEDFAAFRDARSAPHDGLSVLLDYWMTESLTAELQTDRLFPQLWAMALVEPPVQAMLDELYARYLAFIEDCLRDMGVDEPQGDAIVILSLFEGLTLFVDPGRPWEDRAAAAASSVRRLLEARLGHGDDGGVS